MACLAEERGVILQRQWKLAEVKEKIRAKHQALREDLFSDRLWDDADLMVAGIDPGRTGGFAVLNDNTNDAAVAWLPTVTYIHPTKKTKKGVKSRVTEMDWYIFREMVMSFITKATEAGCYYLFCVEKQQTRGKGSGDGVVGVANLLCDYGRLTGIPFGVGLEVQEILPAVWKRKLDLTKPNDTKRHALDLANKLFPSVSLPLVKDHNRAEALLLAQYGRQNLDERSQYVG